MSAKTRVLLSILAVAACLSAPALAADAPLAPGQERALKAKDSFRECETCPEMVVVPAGSFTMGSPDDEKDRDEVNNRDESPQHQVTIKRPFAVGKFEVTRDQFANFVTETRYNAGADCWTFEQESGEPRPGRSFRNPGYEQNGSHPAACLNWKDAKAYVGWLSRKTGKRYRLLSEAEWEYAARGRTTVGPAPRFHFGDDEKAMCRYGNVADQTAEKTIPGTTTWPFFPCDDGYAFTAPVGSFAANGFGLHDMHGNVWEWTEDCYHFGYRGAPTNGSVWTGGDCKNHVLRGGAWIYDPGFHRAALRFSFTAVERYSTVGFRVARTLAR